MFFESEGWERLSEKELEKAVAEHELEAAVDIEIVIGNGHRVFEEHKFYQVSSYRRLELFKNIAITKISPQGVEFDMRINNDQSNVFTINIGQEKEIEYGHVPFLRIYKIRVSNIRYGQIMEM